MQLLKDQFLNQKISHHFQIIEGPVVDTISYIKNELKSKLQFDHFANANYKEFIFDNLLVDDVRDIIKSSGLKVKNQETGVIIIGCHTINVQSQNALLKLTEESHKNKIIFLVIPDITNLLPTLKSRAVVSKYASDGMTDPYYFVDSCNSFSDIQKLSPKGRLELVTLILDKVEKKEVPKDDVKKIINDIIKNLRENLISNPASGIEKIKKFNQISFYINQNGASLKNILEFIFLSF